MTDDEDEKDFLDSEELSTSNSDTEFLKNTVGCVLVFSVPESPEDRSIDALGRCSRLRLGSSSASPLSTLTASRVFSLLDRSASLFFFFLPKRELSIPKSKPKSKSSLSSAESGASSRECSSASSGQRHLALVSPCPSSS